MKRTQILFPEEQYRRLQREAAGRKCSVGELVRAAVANEYFRQSAKTRLKAARRIARMRLPVANWPQMEREIERGALSD
jgi:hypothetical protein